MTLTKHLVTTVVIVYDYYDYVFDISTGASDEPETYRDADLDYTIDYPSGWEASDAFGILEIDSPKESLVATLQVIFLAVTQV